MDKFVGKWILVAIFLLIALPITIAYVGNSVSYDVVVTKLSTISYEETTYKTIGFDSLFNYSIEVNIEQMPVEKGGNSLNGMYEVLPGISRILGPLAFNISLTSNKGQGLSQNSQINCTGYNIFSDHTMPKGWYKFSDNSGLSTNWSESGLFNCSQTSSYNGKPNITYFCNGNKLTCHFKVDDSFLNSTAINYTKDLNLSPYITWINFTPIIAYKNNTLNCSANATDPEGQTSLTYYYIFQKDNYTTLQDWSINNLFNCNATSGCRKHDNITCYIMADDGLSNSTFNSTQSIEILNTKPRFNNITTTNSLVKYGDLINVTANNIYDLDNDSVRLECGNQTLQNNICIGEYSTNRSLQASCINNSLWNDDNEHTIFCRVYDGEEYSIEEFNVTILSDNTKPRVTLISPINASVWNQSIITTYIFNVTDTNSILYCELNINGTNIKNITNVQKNIPQNFTYNFFKGVHYWNITCYDETYNNDTSQTWSINKTLGESIHITNIGATGFERTNQEYTYTRMVIINTLLSETSTNCRYRNENENFTDNWEICTETKEWVLSEYDGEKTIYAEINHTGIDDGKITYYSDKITLQSNATNLDTTPPNDFSVNDTGEFTNKNTTFVASWDVPYDYETILTNGQISFEYMLLDNSTQTNVTGWNGTYYTNIEITGLALLENHTYVLIVNATNPAGLTKQSRSNGITIDITPPNITSIISNRQNNTWTNNNSVEFNITSEDLLSGVKGYSAILDNDYEINITDEINEDINGTLDYNDLDDGIYYVHIIPYDKAGNIGKTENYGPIKIDRTPPTSPIIYNPSIYADTDSITFSWTESTDSLSGIKDYNISIVRIEDNTTIQTDNTLNKTYTYFETGVKGYNYYAIIFAYDNAGNFIESVINEDTTPIRILEASPNNTNVIGDPIIKVFTSKSGICYVNGKKMIYTDSKYHETKITDGSESVSIICEDNLGYKTSSNITYTILDSSLITPTLGSIDSEYIGKIISVPFNITGIGQIKKEDFKVYLNDTEINDYSVESTDNKGQYMLKFVISTKGEYSLKVAFNGEESNTINFEALSKTLKITHDETTIQSSTSKIISTEYSDKTFGIATDSDEATKAGNGQPFNIKIDETGKAYIFFTKKNINSKSKNEYFEKKTFDKTLNSFGYQKIDEYIIGNTLMYDYITITGLNEIEPGIHNLFIRNLGGNKSKTTISIEIE